MEERAATISVTYDDLPAEAFRHANRIQGELLLRRRSIAVRFLQGMIFMLLVVLLAGVAATLMGMIAGGWVSTLAVGILVSATLYLVLVRITRRNVAEAIVGPLTVTVGPEGLHSKDQQSESRFDWAAVQGCYETESLYVFIVKSVQFVALPQSALDAHQRTEFIRIVEQHVPLEAMTRQRLRTDRRRRHRTANRVALAMLAVLAIGAVVWVFAPWRQAIQIIEGQDMRYVEYLAGDAVDRPNLPLVIALHGWGSFPELMRIGLLRHLGTPARVIVPAAPYRWLLGHSWDNWDEQGGDWDDFARQYRDQAARIALLSQALQQRYPEAGRPVVTGFSQGATLAYTVALRHGEEIAGAVPIAGSLAEHASPERIDAAPPIRAIHGAADDLLEVEWALESVEFLRELGFDAQLQVFPGLGHKLNDDARAHWREQMAMLLIQTGAQPVP